MQLDETQIAIRERSTLDLLDLATHVLRNYVRPLLAVWGLGIAGFCLLNQFLLRQLSEVSWAEDGVFEVAAGGTFDYVRNMVFLVVLEAPLATALVTKYLGEAVFLKQPSVKSAIKDTYRLYWRLFWCHFVLRGLGPGLVCAWFAGASPDFTAGDFFLMVTAAVFAFARAWRPFINEIILLERNPLRGRAASDMTVGRRSSLLHSAVGGDLFVKWMGYSVVGGLLSLSFFFAMVFASGVFLNDWSIGPIMIQVCVPLALWIVAGYLAVVRFLAYLDLRIRCEGWEVELRMRAEGARLEAHAF